MMETRLAFDRDLREYNAANGITEGFTPVVNPRRRAELRDRGKDLIMIGRPSLAQASRLAANPGQASLSTVLLPRT